MFSVYVLTILGRERKNHKKQKVDFINYIVFYDNSSVTC